MPTRLITAELTRPLTSQGEAGLRKNNSLKLKIDESVQFAAKRRQFRDLRIEAFEGQELNILAFGLID